MYAKLGVVSLLSGVAFAAANCENGTFLERDVVVIGGGASGTYAAVRLQEEGQSVILLEKEDHLGGHTTSYVDPDTGLPFNLGVAILHDTPIVQNYFQSLGVPLAKGGVPGQTAEQVYADLSTGKVLDYLPPSQEEFGAALGKYAQIVGTEYPYLSLGYDLPDPVPEELLAPFGDFVEKHDLGALVHQANAIAGANGNALERPLLYSIKVFSPLLIQAMMSGFVNAASGDNKDLYRAAEDRLGVGEDAILSTQITKVTREEGHVIVNANTADGEIVIKGDKLVLAIAPTVQNLESIGLDITTEERSLLSKFDGFMYGSVVIQHDGLTGEKAFTNVGEETEYNLFKLPAALQINPLAGTNKYSSWFGGLDASWSETQIKDLVRKQVKNLEDEGVIKAGEVSFEYFGNHSPYHMYAPTSEIRDGFYKKLYALEGKKNTFWTGAAFVENDSTLIWTWTEAVLLQQIISSLQ